MSTTAAVQLESQNFQTRENQAWGLQPPPKVVPRRVRERKCVFLREAVGSIPVQTRLRRFQQPHRHPPISVFPTPLAGFGHRRPSAESLLCRKASATTLTKYRKGRTADSPFCIDSNRRSQPTVFSLPVEFSNNAAGGGKHGRCKRLIQFCVPQSHARAHFETAGGCVIGSQKVIDLRPQRIGVDQPLPGSDGKDVGGEDDAYRMSTIDEVSIGDIGTGLAVSIETPKIGPKPKTAGQPNPPQARMDAW